MAIDLMNIERNVVTSSPLDKIFLFYGEPGTRKTTVAAGDVEKTLLIAFEIGYKFIPGVMAQPVTKWYQFKEIINQLDNIEIKKVFSTVVIDTVGLAYKACVSSVCAANGVAHIGDIPYGRGYALAKDDFERTINLIPQMGYGLKMIAHSSELDDEKAGISVKVDIDKRPSGVIKGLADFIFYTRKEPSAEDPNVETVYAYSSVPSNQIEVKSRARFFPARFEFTHKNLIKELKTAIEKQNEFFGVKSTEQANFEAYKSLDATPEEVEEIKKEITVLGKELMESAYKSEVEKLIHENLKGIRISEADISHIENLHNIKMGLIAISKKV